jgi:hypothetical protein
MLTLSWKESDHMWSMSIDTSKQTDMHFKKLTIAIVFYALLFYGEYLGVAVIHGLTQPVVFS